MVKFPDSKIREIRNTADIVEVISDYVNLRKVGPSNYKGLCPFHAEKTPSFTVSAEKNLYHCFGCGAGGDIFKFLTEYHHVPFIQAVKDLAKRYQINLPHDEELKSGEDKIERILRLNETAADYYSNILRSGKEAQPARDYLKGRGFSEEEFQVFGFGYSPAAWDSLSSYLSKKNVSLRLAEEAGLLVQRKSGGFYDRFRNRIMLPIHDASGRVIAFGGRVLDNSLPKYLNSPETAVYRKGNSLYGLNLCRNYLRKSGFGIIVEGYFDFLSLYAAGIRNVAATLGTALTVNHLRKLKGYVKEIVIVFDSDQAGVNAALRSIPLFLKEEIAAKVLALPVPHDPDTYVRENGQEKFQTLVNEAPPMSAFLFSSLAKKWGKSLEAKINSINETRPLLESITDPLQRSVYVAEAAKYLSVPVDAFNTAAEHDGNREIRAVLNNPSRETISSCFDKTLLEIILLYPEYIPAILKEQGDDFTEGDDLRKVFAHLEKLEEKEGLPDIFSLLTAAENDGLSSRLRAIMLNAPPYERSEVENMIKDILNTIRRRKVDFQKKELLKQVEEAERNGRHSLVLDLLKKKKELLDHGKTD